MSKQVREEMEKLERLIKDFQEIIKELEARLGKLNEHLIQMGGDK